MKNYQKLSYQEYRIMLSDGSSIVTTRQECFSIEPASEGCPFKQRWYYSPDQYMAVRLPRNELGERLGKDNAADFKAQERLIARNRERNTEIDAYTTEDSVSFEIPDPDTSVEDTAIMKCGLGYCGSASSVASSRPQGNFTPSGSRVTRLSETADTMSARRPKTAARTPPNQGRQSRPQ